jgi:hypothetical protein
LTLAHTWRAAKPSQTCQECRQAEAIHALTIKGSKSGEELLCAACALRNAKLWLLSTPPQDPTRAAPLRVGQPGEETSVLAHLTGQQETDEAADVTSISGLDDHHRRNL